MRFEFGAVIPRDESRQLEFKAVTSKNPVRTIADTSDEYAVAFLNSSGGRILWGVRDADKVVIGVPLTAQQRDELRRAVTDRLNSIEPRIDPTRFKFNIHSVRKVPAEPELYVVSLAVPRVAGEGPFYASGRDAYVRLDGANKRLSGPELTAWIAARTGAIKRPVSKTEPPRVEVYSAGDELPLKHEIILDLRHCSRDRPRVELDFHLPASVTGRCKMTFGIVTSSFITRVADWSSEYTGPIALPDGRYLFTSDMMGLQLLPGGWHRYEFTIDFRVHVVNRREQFAIRLFYETGPIDVPFALRMLGREPSRMNLPLED